MNSKLRFASLFTGLALVLSLFLVNNVFNSNTISAMPTALTLTAPGLGVVPDQSAFISNRVGLGTTTNVLVGAEVVGTVRVNVTTDDAVPPATIDVTVTNTSRNRTFTLTLNQTAGNNYEGRFTVVQVEDEDLTPANLADPDFGIDQPLLGANDGENIRVTAVPEIRDITVDGIAPTASDLVPLHNAVTRSTTVTFSGTVSDSRSKVVGADTSVEVLVNGVVVPRAAFSSFNPTTDTADSYSFVLLRALTAGNHTWQVRARDGAGNLFTSDADTATAAKDPNAFEIDGVDPDITSAKSGEDFDTGVTPNVIKNTNNPTKIKVEFSDRMNPASIDPNGADFQVRLGGVGIAVVGARTNTQAFKAAAVGPPATPEFPELRTFVILDLGQDLPTNAGATGGPTLDVVIVGIVEDKSGRTAPGFTVETVNDGLKPNLDVEILNGGVPGTRDKITYRITSDEDANFENIPAGAISAGGPLALELRRVEADSVLSAPVAAPAPTRKQITARRVWEVTYDFDENTQGQMGLYNLVIRVNDRAAVSNIATAGDTSDGRAGITGVAGDGGVLGAVVTGTDTSATKHFDINSTSALRLEVDTLAGGGISSITPTTTDNPAFLVFNTEENREYGLLGTSGSGAFLHPPGFNGNQPADIRTNLDRSGNITVNSFKIGGVEQTFNTRDDRQFVVDISGLVVGEHKIVVEVEDRFGNKKTFEHTLKTLDPQPVTGQVVPGWAFISFQNDFANGGDPNQIFPPSVDALVGFNPDIIGNWVSCVRDDTGVLICNVNQLDPSVSYSVHSDQFDDFSYFPEIFQPGSQQLPEIINVPAGFSDPAVWVLEKGTLAVEADAYLGNYNFALVFDNILQTQRVIRKGDTMDIAAGEVNPYTGKEVAVATTVPMPLIVGQGVRHHRNDPGILFPQ